MSGNLSKSTFFEGGWVTFGEYLTGNKASSTKQCWCQKTRLIAVSCGIKISAVRHLILSQYTRLTDGQTDGQNCDSNTVRCITCSRTVKISHVWLLLRSDRGAEYCDHFVCLSVLCVCRRAYLWSR